MRGLSGTQGEALFSDNVIGFFRSDGSLRILAVIEVKASYRGHAQAVEQIFEWTERRIEDGLEIVLPRGARSFDDLTGPGRVRTRDAVFDERRAGRW